MHMKYLILPAAALLLTSIAPTNAHADKPRAVNTHHYKYQHQNPHADYYKYKKKNAKYHKQQEIERLVQEAYRKGYESGRYDAHNYKHKHQSQYRYDNDLGSLVSAIIRITYND